MQRSDHSEKDAYAGHASHASVASGRASPAASAFSKGRPDSIPINPFATPQASVPTTRAPSLRAYPSSPGLGAGGYFRSRRVPKGTIQTPKALKGKKGNDPWLWIIPTVGFLLGLGAAGALVYFGITWNTSSYNYCPILTEEFSSGTLDESIWTKEIRLNGFG